MINKLKDSDTFWIKRSLNESLNLAEKNLEIFKKWKEENKGKGFDGSIEDQEYTIKNLNEIIKRLSE